MERLSHLLRAELSRPRELPGQVVRHLNASYGVSRDEVGPFLEQQLAGLEDYEIDLLFSPVFTPTLNDQALFAPVLGKEALSRAEIAALIQQLVGTSGCLLSGPEQKHSFPLREVSVARYVERLRLEGQIPEALYAVIISKVPEADRAMTLAVARRSAWEGAARQELLTFYLERALASSEFHLEDVTNLLRLVEAYDPPDRANFQARLPGWIESLRQEESAAHQPKPFFNDRVEDLHGGGRDQRRGDPRAASREAEMDSYRRLLRLLSH